MSTSDSTHLMHVVAREGAIAPGVGTDQLVAYASSQAHSSVERGARVAGFRHVRLVDVDADYAMRADALEKAIAEDRAAGLTPAIVTSTIGTTGTGAVDPVARIADIAGAEGTWHHVDAAWAGSAMCLPESRHLQAGVEHVDSYTFNPHKWMFTNFDCNVLWVADREPLDLDALHRPAVPPERGERIGCRHRLPRLARSARSSFPRAQALVGPPPLRRERDSTSHRGAHPSCGRLRTACGRRACVGARRARPAGARLLRTSRRERRDQRTRRRHQHRPRRVRHAVPGRRPTLHTGGDRADPHDRPGRGSALGRHRARSASVAS